MVAVSSWGRLFKAEHQIKSLYNIQTLDRAFEGEVPGIAFGMGRSYGDVCLNPGGLLWKTTGLDRFIEFDEKTGRLVCEAGVLLGDIQRLVIPRGWILPVTPGTQFVTVGGAIANDIHGKNHHVEGSFGDHIHHITLARTAGAIIECGPSLEKEWFCATIGGLGLTGCILKALIQLKRVPGPWLKTKLIPYGNLDEFFELADATEAEWEHTVAWVDCVSKNIGRGIFMCGSPAHTIQKEPQKRKLIIPCVPPVSLINKLTLRAFNAAYYYMKKRSSVKASTEIVHYESFLYPLDNVSEWNRIYGPKGFFQYQSLIPREVGLEGIRAMLEEIARSGEGSFLAVLKTFGKRHSVGMLGFPKPGVTLALDFPNRGEKTQKLFRRLDAIVSEAGGRIYLAKDARMPRAMFEAGYPRFREFLQYRDPKISSAMSRRLMGY